MRCLGIRRQTYCRGNGQAQSGNDKRRESMPEPALALSRLRSSADVWILFAFGLLLPVQLPHPLICRRWHSIGPRLPMSHPGREEGYLDGAPTVCLI